MLGKGKTLYLLLTFQKIFASIFPVEIDEFRGFKCLQRVVTLFDLKQPITLVNVTEEQEKMLRNIVKEIYVLEHFNSNYFQVMVFLESINKDAMESLASNLAPLRDTKVLVVSLTQQELSFANSGSYFSVFWLIGRNKLAFAHWNSENHLQVTSNFDWKEKVLCSASLHYTIYRNFCENKPPELALLPQKESICNLRKLEVPAETLAAHKGGNNIGIITKMVDVYAKIKGIKLYKVQDYNSIVQYFFLKGDQNRIIQELRNGTFDVATGPFFANQQPIDYGPIILKDAYIFVVNKAKEKNAQAYLKSFHDRVWHFWLLSCVASISCYYVLHLILEDSKKITIEDALLHIFSMSTAAGIRSPPKSSSLRIFMIFYLMASLTICSVYLGRMSSVLTTDRFLKATTSRLYSLLNSSLRFKYTAYMNSLMHITESARRRSTIHERSIEYFFVTTNGTEWDNLYNVIFKDCNFASITLKSIILAHPSEKKLVDCFEPDQPYSLFMTFYINPASSLKNSLKFWTQELLEKGFTNKWFNDIREENRNYTLEYNNSDDAKPFSISTVKDFFLMLVWTYGFAVLVFALEHVFYKMEVKYGVKQKFRELLLLLKPPAIRETKVGQKSKRARVN